MELKITTKNYIVRGDFSNNTKTWQQFLYIVKAANLTPLAMAKHEFYPQGLSGVVVIGESHVAIHTYPEDLQAYVVIATCGKEGSDMVGQFDEALGDVWEILPPDDKKIQEVSA